MENMLEEYYKYKIDYKDFVIMIKSGNFYEILDKDAVILNQILNYKLSKLADTVKCGFPISSLGKVIDKLLIITRLKKTYEYVLKSLENYPHKYLELKQHIDSTLFEMIELCYIANNGCEVEKNKILVLSKLSMVDYYLKLSYKNEVISKKKYESK